MRTDIDLPIDPVTLNDWLSIERSESDGYQHILIRQKSPGKWQDSIDELTAYFETAHLDARTHFHRMSGLSLHPTGNLESSVQYPNSLPDTCRRGLFGETICGFFAESFRFLDDLPWKVPAFLFRYHQDAENYINRLSRGIPSRQVIGRLGDDFLALALKEDGSVAAILVGEAKFRKYLPKSAAAVLMEEVHEGLSGDAIAPVNLMHLCELLKLKDSDEYETACLDLERASLLGTSDELTRVDLVCLIVQKTKKAYPPTYVPQEERHAAYKSDRKLQVVEVVIEDACDLVSELYDHMYSEGGGTV